MAMREEGQALMATKQTSPELSSLAARVMAGYEPTREEIVSMAASLMSQDETPTEKPADAWGEPGSQREDK